MQNNEYITEGPTIPAGFWVRLAAYLIDSVIIGCLLLIIRLILWIISIIIGNGIFQAEILFQYTIKDILLYICHAAYFIILTYSTGMTIGKRLMNLKVIGYNHEDMTLLSIIYRETIGRFLSSLLCIGYFMIGIDEHKRGLHDILADTQVIYSKQMKIYKKNVYQTYYSAPGTPVNTPNAMPETPSPAPNAPSQNTDFSSFDNL